MPGAIPLVDLTRQDPGITSEIEAAVARVLASGRYVLGPEKEAFEAEIADYVGVSNAVGVGSGTDALFLTLKALGVGPGDEVITTPFTFFATSEVIVNAGATAVFADIDPRTFNIDPDAVSASLTPRTRAVIGVHLYGQPFDGDALSDIACAAGVPLIEDCAQAAGAEYRGRKTGTFGVAGAFSFFPTKNLGAAGDAGMIVTDDQDLAEKVRTLANHGSRGGYLHECAGVNSRLDEVQAAVLRVKLRMLDRWNEERASIAAAYDRGLESVETPYAAPGTKHVYHQYTIMSDRRDVVASALERNGIGCRVYYPVPLHLQPCFEGSGAGPGTLPKSERASERVLSLPIYPGLTAAEIEAVCGAVNSV